MGYVASAIRQQVAHAAKQFYFGKEFPCDDNLLMDLLGFAAAMPEIKTKLQLERIPTYKNVYLVSGGMDSYIQWNSRPWKQTDVLPLFVDYGQPYAKQEEKVIDKYFPGTIKHRHLLPHDPESTKHIIPFRNLYLLTVANTFLAPGGSIHMGIVEGESGDTGDKSLEFLNRFEDYIGKVEWKTIEIVTLANKTKNDILKEYLEATGDLKVFETVTCFSDMKQGHCQNCKACLRKCIAMAHVEINSPMYTAAKAMYPNILDNPHFKAMYETLADCLKRGDFHHYTKSRCEQDIEAMDYLMIKE